MFFLMKLDMSPLEAVGDFRPKVNTLFSLSGFIKIFSKMFTNSANNRFYFSSPPPPTMDLILDGISEIDAHVSLLFDLFKAFD